MKYIKAFVAWVLAEFCIYEEHVQMGFSPMILPEKVHGVARVTDAYNGRMIVPFTVLNPAILELPAASVIQSMFDQITKLGCTPQSLEIHTHDKTRVYIPEQSRPIFTQSRVSTA
jgi:hypothetical protein